VSHPRAALANARGLFGNTKDRKPPLSEAFTSGMTTTVPEYTSNMFLCVSVIRRV
jgi:hypothetical protein